jgi:hypothetical protein
MPTPAGSRIQLKLRCLHNSIRIIEPPTVRVTHLAKKALPMRHPLAPQHRNPLKKRSLKPDEFNSTPTDKMRHPDGARGGGRTALQRLFSPWQAPGFDRHGSEHPRTPKREVDVTRIDLRHHHADLGRFTVDRLMSIVNRLGSRVEVKVKVRRAQPVERRATIAVLTRRPS